MFSEVIEITSVRRIGGDVLVHKLREFEGLYNEEFQIQAGFSQQDVSYRLEFRLSGPLEKLLIPTKAQAPRFRDELWKRTCFEAFLGNKDSEAYWEFSPSRDWAIYRFKSYRERIEIDQLELIDLVIQQERYPGDLILKIDIKPKDLFKVDRVGLTAVLEHDSQKTSYWALTHAREKPDFHAPESLIVSTF